MPTNTNTFIWNNMQLLVPSPHHAILTNHTCQEEGPLAVLFRDLCHHPEGTVNTIDLVGASITLVYVTLSQMRVLHHSRAHNTPFLPLPTGLSIRSSTSSAHEWHGLRRTVYRTTRT